MPAFKELPFSEGAVFMRNIVFFAIRILAFGIVVVAMAGSEPVYAFSQDWGGAEDDWSTPTRTGGGSAPTTMTCAAWAKNGQRCRECATVIRADGTESRYPTCVGVTWSASCRCDNAGTASCRGAGVCDYKP
jgi:hypothetical protein